MKKKFIWLVVSCMMIVSLLVVSCGGADVEEEGEEIVEEEEVGAPGGPQYGGMITTALTADYLYWDPFYNFDIFVWHLMFTHNEYIQGDWTKGPNGTGETDWEIGFLGRVDLLTGEAAESWELPDNETILFHIRPGIYFHDKPPVNGRELTAEDAAWSMEMRFKNPGTWHNMAYPPETGLAPTSFKALDRYTVEVKVRADMQDIMVLEIGDNQYVNAPEIWEGTGPGEGEEMGDWTKVIGTGPFMLADYVADASIEYERNPNYWETDPMYSGNKWPYLDGFKLLVIPDVSTRLAALRTGQIDFLSRVIPDNAKDLQNSTPDLQWKAFVAPWKNAPQFKGNDPSLPWFDDAAGLKVRQAMNLAVNQQEILDEFYDGQGVIMGYPYAPTPTYEPYYIPLEEMPEEVSMLWEYDPERAKELLDEAGYPDGFKFDIITAATDADELVIIREYLADINIEMELDVIEAGDLTGRRNERNYDAIMTLIGIWAPFEQLNTKASQIGAIFGNDDPLYKEVELAIGSYIIKDPSKYIKAVKESAVHELASARAIWMPRPFEYNFWWPWVKDYNGIFWTGWAGVWDWSKSIWLDADLKDSMGY